jgi:four helix bundle protein
MFRFEKLNVWQKAVGFADRIYEVTRQFPADERFGLTSQMRRASVSISSNIVEGSGRSSNRDFVQFIEITYGSVMEVVSQLQIAFRQSFVAAEVRDELYESAEELARLLSGLKASLLRE